MEDLAGLIKARAQGLGFDLVGITNAEPSAFAAEYRGWIAQGYAGEMEYLTRNLERRLDPRELVQNARSIIVVGMNYYTDEGTGNREQGTEEACHTDNEPRTGRPPRSQAGKDTNRASTPLSGGEGHEPRADVGVFARYARGDDYHDVMTARLKELLAFVKERAGEGADGRVYVDAGPVLEREVARRAGLGWYGKNTMLINTRRGSYFFLGEIVTNVALAIDDPAVGGCGTCTRCLDACPTGAILEPYKIDARRCLSYLTIELKGDIPEEFRPALADAGNRIYGCDICQEVCPFNERRSSPTEEPAYQPRAVTSAPQLIDLLLMDDEAFRREFKGSPVKRAKRRGLLRNVAVALAASDDPHARAALEHAVNDVEPIVRDHAKWALEQVKQRAMNK